VNQYLRLFLLLAASMAMPALVVACNAEGEAGPAAGDPPGNEGVAGDDSDGDGVEDDTDNCPSIANASQEDMDNDGTGDACDEDVDGDGINNADDNCPAITNPNQSDSDGDGIGDSCDESSGGVTEICEPDDD